MHYRDLDLRAHYKVRVVYAGDFEPKVRLVAISTSDKSEMREVEIHPFMSKPEPITPVEFAIPSEAISGGELTLSWRSDAKRGGAGRGCQIAEVWLIKAPTK